MKGLAAKALAALADPGLIAPAILGAGTGTPVLDPATGEIIANVPDTTPTLVRAAVDDALTAGQAWAALLPLQRGALLRRWADLIRAAAADLAVLLTAEQGKPLTEAAGEIAYGTGFLDWFAAEGERSCGETLPSHRQGAQSSVIWQPVALAVGITPWNFPMAMIARKAGAALAAGAPMIVKPAPETPLSALALQTLARRAGVPAGVFQVLTGDAPILTRALMAEDAVRAVSFTGSTEVGRLIFGLAAPGVKRLSLELGGHAPFIAFADSPLEATVAGAMAAKFATSGQDCLAANRIYVERQVYDAFCASFAEATARLRVGHGLESGIDIGPMTRASVSGKCRDQIADAVAKGARILTGGTLHPLGSAFVTPTVLADVTPAMAITREETFGPVAALIPFDTEAEVTAQASATEMGLAAYLYTRDVGRITRLTRALEFGMIGVNTASFTGPPIPFGGWKQSGLGREGGRAGITEFMEQKYICIGSAA
jgi:succinate-semialdehyde dehydrogenase/glutarate-semialdehyde dehydrogenase/aspartate-semialdehyde dehydrogenase